MSKKNISLASQALEDMKNLKNAMKEESKNTLKQMLSEAVKDAIRESIEDDDDEEEPEIEGADDNDENESDVAEKESVDEDGEEEYGQQPDGEDMPMGNEDEPQQAEPQEQPEQVGPETGEEGDGWDEFSQYKTGDGNAIDMTQETDMGKVLRAFKLMNQEDQVVVRKEGNTIELTDNETGGDYIIDLGEDETEPDVMNDAQGAEPEGQELNEEYEFEVVDDEDEVGNNLNSLIGRNSDSKDTFAEDDFDDEGDFYSDEYDDVDEPQDDGQFVDVRDMIGTEPAGLPGEEEIYENRKAKTRKTMKEGKKKNEMLFEIDLGYTDNYQDKDPIKGLSNNEPSKSGKTWEKGVPTGTSKPWAGETKSKGDPFKKTQKVEGSINEEDEEVLNNEPAGFQSGDEMVDESSSVSTQNMRKTPKSRPGNVRREHMPQVSKHVSTTEKGYEEMVSEMKKIKSENKQLKEAVMALRGTLNEAYVANVNLGKITKLFVENATTKDEKREIVERFANEAKTVKQSKALYESISKQLNSNVKKNVSLNESSMKVNNMVNESVSNAPSEFKQMIDLMKRMDN